MKKLIIWGSSGHAKVLNDFVGKENFKIVALVDNNPEVSSVIENIPILIGINSLKNWVHDNLNSEELYGAIAIGGSRGKDRLSIIKMLLDLKIKLPNLMHPTSYISNDVSIGIANQCLANSTISASAVLGDGIIVNTSASIDHECIIRDGVHIGPGATLCGCIEVGNNSFIGAGAVILPRIKIGKNVIIGAGSVVTKNIADDMIVMGNPAKSILNIKKCEENE